MNDEPIRRQRRSPANRVWQVTFARVVAQPRGDVAAEELRLQWGEAVILETELWEATNRAYFVARTEDGAVIRELSAGNGYLRDHDHLVGHQVLRQQFDLGAGLAIVRGAMGVAGVLGRASTDDSFNVDGFELEADQHGLPTRLVTEDLVVDWTYGRPIARSLRGPTVTRRIGHSWEVYAYRGLPHLATVVLHAPWLPARIEGGQFVEGFLYANTWDPSVEAHLFWRLDAGPELELIVSDADSDAEVSQLDSVVSRTGAIRMADLRGPSVASAAEAAELFRLDDLVAGRIPMDHFEIRRGVHEIARAHASS